MAELIKTDFKDLFIIKPQVFGDDRGYFVETYNQKTFANLGLSHEFVQDNQSHSQYGTLRGLHFQTGTFAQTKLIRALKGTIFDVAVDLRPSSLTFKKVFSLEISAENFLQLLVPRGFAHGFIVLSPEATVAYKCDSFYNPTHESGVHFNDPELNISWPVPNDKIKVSGKDKQLPRLKDLKL